MDQFLEINKKVLKEQRKLVYRQYRDEVLNWGDAIEQLKKTGLDDQRANDFLLDAPEESL